MKITLVRRFMLTCIALLIMCCMVTGVSVFCMFRTQHSVDLLNNYSVPGLFWAAKLKAVAKDQRIAIILHLISNDPAEMHDLEAKVEQANADLDEARRNYPRTYPQDAEQIAISAASQKQFTEVWYRIRDLSREGKKKEAWDLYNGDLMRATLARRKVEDYLASTSKERGYSIAASAMTLARAGIPIVLVISLLSVLAGTLLTLWTARYVTRRLNHLNDVAQHLAEGDVAIAAQLSGELSHAANRAADAVSSRVESQDEIEVLVGSFGEMVAYLRETAEVSEAIAGGDLTSEVRPRSQGDALGHAFVRMNEGLGTLVLGVRDSAAQVAAGSTQVADASGSLARASVDASTAIEEVSSTMQEMSVNLQSIARSTQTQTANVGQTATAIDQMVASIQRVADNCKVLLDISSRSRDEVRNGISCVDKTAEGLNRISNSIQSSAEIIDALGSRAKDIGRIVEVIDDIAEQTNLLALNAAIEAARAGEHGLGFAVVADEIRKLAEKSAQSTNEISALIQSIQGELGKAIGNMDKSTEMVKGGLVLGSDAGAALQKISSVVEKVYSCAQEIGTATAEQSRGSQQIGEATTHLKEITQEITCSVEEQATGAQGVVNAMDRMRELVQRSSSGSAELAASSDQMSKMSVSLLNMMNRFKLPSLQATRRSMTGAGGYIKSLPERRAKAFTQGV